MSTELPQRTHSIRRGCRITIVAATYNEQFTDALVENCLAELQEADSLIDVDVVRVPGAYEVPMVVRHAIVTPAEDYRPDAVIALGVILRGSTAHADLIGTAITNKLLDISCETLVPVIHEVLLLQDEQQAFARCIASALNRGREAARSAINMVNVMDERKDAIRIAQRSARVNLHGSLLS